MQAQIQQLRERLAHREVQLITRHGDANGARQQSAGTVVNIGQPNAVVSQLEASIQSLSQLMASTQEDFQRQFNCN